MIINYEDIDNLAEVLRKNGQTIALTNGTFDLLHAGHVTYLQEAKQLADVLIVGINSDSSVRQYKSPLRPIIPEEYRAKLIASLSCVDYVVIFPETTANNLIKKIKPHIYVKGGDYTEESLPEASTVKENKGRIEFIPMVDNCSTTNIINKILKVYEAEKA